MKVSGLIIFTKVHTIEKSLKKYMTINILHSFPYNRNRSTPHRNDKRKYVSVTGGLPGEFIKNKITMYSYTYMRAHIHKFGRLLAFNKRSIHL